MLCIVPFCTVLMGACLDKVCNHSFKHFIVSCCIMEYDPLFVRRLMLCLHFIFNFSVCNKRLDTQTLENFKENQHITWLDTQFLHISFVA